MNSAFARSNSRITPTIASPGRSRSTNCGQRARSSSTSPTTASPPASKTPSAATRAAESNTNTCNYKAPRTRSTFFAHRSATATGRSFFNNLLGRERRFERRGRTTTLGHVAMRSPDRHGTGTCFTSPPFVLRCRTRDQGSSLACREPRHCLGSAPATQREGELSQPFLRRS
jgi:hypothetical protein